MRVPFLQSARREWGGPLVVAVLATGAILCSLDPAGTDPSLPQGPGLTLDESINTEYGVRLSVAVPELIYGGLTVAEAFGEKEDLPDAKPRLPYHLPDYPPLGRLWLGCWHNLALSLAPPTENSPPPIVIARARTASAIAFGLTILLVGWAAARWYGPGAGWWAAISLVLMPRVFGHAHLASVETVMGLTFAAAAIAFAAFWSRERPPTWKIAALTGAILGIAFLTKIQAVLLPIPITLWAVVRFRQRAIGPLVVTGLVTAIVFLCGWPWLWLDPIEHTRGYLLGATDRVLLKVFYLGESYADREVPRHYSLVMFLTTVPIGLQLLGACGLCCRRNAATDNRSRDRFLAACIAFPLLLFAMPGVTVYDGARLFLVAFPLWAILIGRGGVVVWERICHRFSAKTAACCCLLFVAIPLTSLLTIRPYYLSYYNGSVGGLWGAEKLGFEPTYWGDSISRDLLRDACEAVPERAKIDVSPVLHPRQLPVIIEQSPILRKRGIELRGYDPSKNGPAKYLLLFRRRADLSPEVDPPKNAKLLAEVRRRGVLLAALYEMKTGEMKIGKTNTE